MAVRRPCSDQRAAFANLSGLAPTVLLPADRGRIPFDRIARRDVRHGPPGPRRRPRSV